MAKKITSKQLNEAASWDDETKKYIDKLFVSFDEDEQYEVRDLMHALIKRIGHSVDKDELMRVILTCKEKGPHNNPRDPIVACVLKAYDIEIED